MKILFIVELFLIIPHLLFAQTTPKPTPPLGGVNSVYFDPSISSYIFEYLGSDGNLKYIYNLNNGGYLLGLKAIVNDSYTFWPSVGGGLVVIPRPGDTVYSWQNNLVSFQLLSNEFDGNNLKTNWEMTIIIDELVFYYYFIYEMHIDGRTLVIKIYKDDGIESSGDIVSEVNLDRSEDTWHPVVIGVPNLTLFNILYSSDQSTSLQNRVFSSMFFDWTVTGGSALQPLNENFSLTSNRYSQRVRYNTKTDGNRNPLTETLYLTISPTIDDVFPNIPNSVSPMRLESVNRIVWDLWGDFDDCMNELNTVTNTGIENIWMIIHYWQRHDNNLKCPDIYPANDCINRGYGIKQLLNIRAIANLNDYLFSLHENYVDYMEDAVGFFTKDDAAVNSNEDKIVCFHFDMDLDLDCYDTKLAGWDSYTLNSSKMSNYYAGRNISSNIHSDYGTNASYLDVHSSYDPSIYVDHDFNEQNAGLFTEVLLNNQQIANDERTIHEGPVSGEGLAHFLYAGYYDDFENQIHTGKSLPGMHYLNLVNCEQCSEYYGGYYKPLLVNFELEKMRDKTFSHGVGYLERFFLNGGYGYWDLRGRSKDSSLCYIGTYLAYGTGAYLPNGTYNLTEYANLLKDYVYPIQLYNGNSSVSGILYNDGGFLVSASDYIKNHPGDFDNINSANFMSQVIVNYENGCKVFVNRNRYLNWDITAQVASSQECYLSYNVLAEDPSVVIQGHSPLLQYILPKEQGWLFYSPTQLPGDRKDFLVNEPGIFKLHQNYPNPFNPSTRITYEIPKDGFVTIKVFNIVGQGVVTLVNNEFQKRGSYDVRFYGNNFASGVYFYEIQTGNHHDSKKMVLIK